MQLVSEREEKDERKEDQDGFKVDDQMQYNGCLSILDACQLLLVTESAIYRHSRLLRPVRCVPSKFSEVL
jgi:hypothetical protein